MKRNLGIASACVFATWVSISLLFPRVADAQSAVLMFVLNNAGTGQVALKLDVDGRLPTTANIAPLDSAGRLATTNREIPHWQVGSVPAVATQATVTQAAGGVGIIRVADCVSATLVAGTVVPAAATQVNVYIRDGAAGAGTIVWRQTMALPATVAASAPPVNLCGLHIPGTANTAMSVEFSAAGSTNTFQAVTLTGYDR